MMLGTCILPVFVVFRANLQSGYPAQIKIHLSESVSSMYGRFFQLADPFKIFPARFGTPFSPRLHHQPQPMHPLCPLPFRMPRLWHRPRSMRWGPGSNAGDRFEPDRFDRLVPIVHVWIGGTCLELALLTPTSRKFFPPCFSSASPRAPLRFVATSLPFGSEPWCALPSAPSKRPVSPPERRNSLDPVFPLPSVPRGEGRGVREV
eukprot:scaffold1052_cov339-Pavlova_lutheri.AAC.57